MPARVLIVDDEPDLRFLIRRALSRRAEWDVIGEAEDGHAAVRAVEEHRPDVVLLDLVMAHPGEDALPSLITLAPACMIVVFTALKAEEHRDRLLSLGAFSYYEKGQLDQLPDLLAADYDRFQRALDGEDVVPSWLDRPRDS